MLCWLGEDCTLADCLKSFGYSQQKIKKSLPKKRAQALVKKKGEVRVPLELFNLGLINPTFSSPSTAKPQILEKRNDFWSLYKPSLIHSHPLKYNEEDNMLSFLKSKGEFDVLRVNSKNYDRGLLYRLDHETSGLLMATTKESLYEGCRNGDVLVKKKTYFARVSGEYKGFNELSNRLSTSGKKIKEDSSGKEAHLKVIGMEYSKELNESLLKLEIREGLRHQIRIQLSLAGFPIVGDELYGGSQASYFGLFCYSYEIAGEIFTAPLKESFLHLNSDF